MNTLELQLLETQSGIKRIDVIESGALISYSVINDTIFMELEGLERISERKYGGTVYIELEDNKGNSNLYELHIYHNIPYTPPEYSNPSSDTGWYIGFGIFILIALIFLAWLDKKRHV